MTRLLAASFLTLLSVFLLASCSFIPANTSANVPATDRQRSMFQEPGAVSGAMLASGEVPWWVPHKCRLGFSLEKWRDAHAKGGSPPQLSASSAADFWAAYCSTIGQAEPEDEEFVGLALSGGGMRAAVFSSAVMFELQAEGILPHVDVVSAVSGGSAAAALFALSCDDPANCPKTVEGPPRCQWRPEPGGQSPSELCRGGVFQQLQGRFETQFILKALRPDRAFQYWFTHLDRSDIMAETLADNLYDTSILGAEGFRFHDLNPQRPSLIINATNFTKARRSLIGESDSETRRKLIEHLNFQFTGRNFEKLICSNLDQYPVANAVMASSAFPGLFQYVTLSNYCPVQDGGRRTYKHLFDGGNSDNLGLIPFERMFDAAKLEKLLSPGGRMPNRAVVLEVKATLGLPGKSPNDPDPRSVLDYIIDTNFLDTTDSLMIMGYDRIEGDVRQALADLECRGGRDEDDFSDRHDCAESAQLVTVALSDLKWTDIPGGRNLWRCVKEIGTRFQIDQDAVAQLRLAAKMLVGETLKDTCNRSERQSGGIQLCAKSDATANFAELSQQLCP